MKIDEWLPNYQVSARYSVPVHASPERTYDSLATAKFSDLRVARVLMRLRGYRIEREKPASIAAPEPFRRYGLFLELATVSPEEVVLGIAGRFWRPDGGLVRDLRPAEFLAFDREGYAKAVWNFSIAPSNDGVRLTTETRVQTFGRSATLKFRLYWLLVGPFSGLIRGAMLREVKRIAEQSP